MKSVLVISAGFKKGEIFSNLAKTFARISTRVVGMEGVRAGDKLYKMGTNI